VHEKIVMSETLPEIRVSRVLGTGEIELETDSPGVRDRAIESHLNAAPETFVYWTGTQEDVVTGRVTSLKLDTTPVAFSVMTTEISE
jgi:phage gp37-like protein